MHSLNKNEQTDEVRVAQWFSFHGRINRIEYLMRVFLILCISSGILGREAYSYGIFDLFLLLVLGAVQWFLVASGAKRWHDIGHTWVRSLGSLLLLPWLLIISGPGNGSLGTQYGTWSLTKGAMSLYWTPIDVWLLGTSGAEVWQNVWDNAVSLIVTILFLVAVMSPAFGRGEIGPNQFGAGPRLRQANPRSWMSFSGRIAGSAYATRVCLCLFLASCIYMLTGVVDHFYGGKARIAISYGLSGGIVASIGGLSGFTDLALYFAFIGVIWLFLATGAKRWHDLGRTGVFAIVNVLVVPAIALMVIKGNHGANRYGESSLIER